MRGIHLADQCNTSPVGVPVPGGTRRRGGGTFSCGHQIRQNPSMAPSSELFVSLHEINVHFRASITIIIVLGDMSQRKMSLLSNPRRTLICGQDHRRLPAHPNKIRLTPARAESTSHVRGRVRHFLMCLGSSCQREYE